jgi:hypothetical protein
LLQGLCSSYPFLLNDGSKAHNSGASGLDRPKDHKVLPSKENVKVLSLLEDINTCAEVVKIYSKNEFSMIMKKEQEIHFSFIVLCTKIQQCVTSCLFKLEKSLNLYMHV